ncbi:MAG: glycosyltransferase family 4 protein [Anaerolineae bacterium]|nr:glycosyltransferase family 4 protein [Gemmatimonadaceae bacterium]
MRHHRRVRDAIIRWWMRRSDALMYIGKANREAYLHYGAREEKLFFSPFSVDVELIDGIRASYTGGERSVLRQRWGLPPNIPVVLSVGKLVHQKRPHAVLDIARALGDSAHVVFAGSGPVEPELKARAAADGLDNVSFLGFVNQSKLPEVFACADIFVMASTGETWGLVVNEAMAAGAVPVVTNEVGSHYDLITEGLTGYVVPAGDDDSMIFRVSALVSDEALRARLSDAARKRIGAYTYDATAEGILTALRAVGALPAAALNTGASVPAVVDASKSMH